MIWLAGAGPCDPDLVPQRTVELLRTAPQVVADPALWPLVRELRGGVGSAAELHAPVDGWWERARPGSVRLYAGDAMTGVGPAGPSPSLAERTALERAGLAWELVPGVALDAAERAAELLGPSRRARRPLAGRSVVVTRPVAQQASLATALRRLGATVVSVPTIRIGPAEDGGAALRAALADAGRYRWVVVTSANGVAALLDALPDARHLAGVRIAAIGPATAAALAAAHLGADLVPQEFVAEALLDAFPAPDRETGSGRVLVVRAAVARDTLPAGLRRAGWDVDVVAAYRTLPAVVPDDVRAAVAAADVVTFTSPSTVHRFVEQLGDDGIAVGSRGGALPVGPAVIAIGPVTAEAARAAGIRVDAVAARYDVDGLVDAVVRWAASG